MLSFERPVEVSTYSYSELDLHTTTSAQGKELPAERHVSGLRPRRAERPSDMAAARSVAQPESGDAATRDGQRAARSVWCLVYAVCCICVAFNAGGVC